MTGMITSEYRTQITPVAAKANGMQMSIHIAVQVVRRHTEVLGYAQFVRWSVQVFQTRSNQTPLHQRGPKEHGLGTYLRKPHSIGIILMSPEPDVNTVTKQEIAKYEPAGWFMNPENREAPAEAAAPDMLSTQ